MIVSDHGGSNDGIATVVEGDGQYRVWPAIGLGDGIRPAPALHPGHLDLTARPQHRWPFAHQAEVGQAIEFVVVCDPCQTVAKPDLGSNVDADLTPAICRDAAEGLALAPFVGRKRPTNFGKFRM